jgi:hypothetical protein
MDSLVHHLVKKKSNENTLLQENYFKQIGEGLRAQQQSYRCS